MAAMAAAVAGGSMMSSASQLGSSLGTAKMQSDTAIKTNTQNLDFQKSMIDRGESAFTEVGMPRYLFWSGNTTGIPNTLFHLGGTNFYESSGVNANLPYFSANPYSQFSHAATPNTKQLNSRTEMQHQPFISGSTGQTDRVGLGVGRYNAVPPPTLTYNSVAVGTNVPTTSRATNAVVSTREGYSQTPVNPYRYVRSS